MEGMWSTLCRDSYELKSLSLKKLGLGLGLASGRELWFTGGQGGVGVWPAYYHVNYEMISLCLKIRVRVMFRRSVGLN